MNNDLISREALKKALKSNCDLCHDKNTNWCEHCCPLNDFEDLIDNAPTVTPDKIQAIMSDYLVYRCEPQRPQGEWKEFAEFVAKEVCTDNFKDNSDSFAELACRKLVKLGLLKLDGDIYKKGGKE